MATVVVLPSKGLTLGWQQSQFPSKGQALRLKPVVWPIDGNGNFRLCSHALGKVNVFIDKFSVYFVLVYIVDDEYKLANS